MNTRKLFILVTQTNTTTIFIFYSLIITTMGDESSSDCCPPPKTRRRKMRTNGANTNTQDIHLYPALQMRFNTHDQNTA